MKTMEFEQNNAQENDAKDRLVTTQHGMFAFRISCAWINVWKPSIGETLVAKREFDNPMDKHAMKVVLGN